MTLTDKLLWSKSQVVDSFHAMPYLVNRSYFSIVTMKFAVLKSMENVEKTHSEAVLTREKTSMLLM